MSLVQAFYDSGEFGIAGIPLINIFLKRLFDMISDKIIPGGKSTVTQTYDGIEISIPVPRNIFAMLFMCFWLCGWAVGEVFAAGALGTMLYELITTGKSGPGAFVILFLIVWLSFWTFGGIMAIRQVLRMAFGRDVIKVSAENISITEKIGDRGKPKTYDIPNIKSFRLVEETGLSGRRNPMKSGPALTFDYKGKTIQFGNGLNLEELESLMDLIRKNAYLKRENFAKSTIRMSEKPTDKGDWPEKSREEREDDDIYYAGFDG